MDETFDQVEEDEINVRNEQFRAELAPFQVESIAGMPTYEGEANIVYIDEQEELQLKPVKARIILGPDVPLPPPNFDDSFHGMAESSFQALFMEAMSQLTVMYGYNADDDPDRPHRMAFEAILREAADRPNRLIDVVYAHGINTTFYHYVLREGRIRDFGTLEEVFAGIDDGRIIGFNDTLLAAIKQRDGMEQDDSDIMVVLATCNPPGRPIEGSAILISRGGKIGGINVQGPIQIYDPVTGKTTTSAERFGQRP